MDTFCSKFRFKSEENRKIYPNEYCLLGSDGITIAFIEWDRRGQCGFSFTTATLADLIFID